MSEDGGVLLGGGEEMEVEVEGDIQSRLAEQIDLLGDKKLVPFRCLCMIPQAHMCCHCPYCWPGTSGHLILSCVNRYQ